MLNRIAVFASLLLLSWSALAQAPAPAAEVKKLNYFAGTWTLDADMKPSQFGPGGRMTETEKNEWMEGGFFLVAHVDVKAAMGNGSGLAIMGYNADEKVYSYDAFNSWGQAEHAKGTLEGDTWTWNSENKMNGQTAKTRFTIKQLSPTSYSFKFEMAGADRVWSTVAEGKATKAQ